MLSPSLPLFYTNCENFVSTCSTMYEPPHPPSLMCTPNVNSDCAVLPQPPCPPPLSYTRDELFAVKPSTLDPSLNLRLRRLRLGVNLPRARGSRGGRRKQRRVNVVDRPPSPPSALKKPQRSVDDRNLIVVPLTKSGTAANRDRKLTLGLFNAQSVGGRQKEQKEKRAAINAFVLHNYVDIMCITESWLQPVGDEPKCRDLAPPGYSTLNFPRRSGGGGGIVFVVSDALSPFISTTPTFPFEHKSYELHQISVSLPHSSLHLFCLYRPPPSQKNKLKHTDFMNEFPDFLEHMNSLKGHSIVVGDFNFHWDNPSNTYTARLRDLLDSFSLKQYVDTPTQRSGHILDWVIHLADGIVESVATSLTLTSDHHSILAHLNLIIPPPPPRYVHARNIASIDLDTFRADLLSGLQSSASPTAEQFHRLLLDALDRHAPATRRRVSSRPPSPWFSAVGPQLLEAKRERRRAERQWRKTGLHVHKQILQAANNAVGGIVLQAKSAFFSAKILACTTSKQLFQVTNSLLGKAKSTPLPSSVPPSELPQKFCDFFIGKIRTLRDGLDAQSVPLPNVDHSVFSGDALCAFSPVTESVVKEVIKKTVIKTCELDPLPSSLLSELIDDLLPYITDVINDSICSGCFPSVFKSAIIKPLLKKPSLDPDNLKNYRPVSNLSFLSKIVEKIVLLQLSEHLHRNNLFYTLQSAYRPGHSTETALLKIVNDLLTAIDTNQVSLLSLLDLSAAFDTIDHSALISRLRNTFGVSGSALSWFQSYLSGRTQVVSLNGISSAPAALQYGVPQGSVLGPILFVLYTQPISDIVAHHNLSHHCFSDDNQLYKSGDLSQLSLIIQSTQLCIADVKAWMTNNKLQLNDDKTEVIYIASKKHLTSDSMLDSVQLDNCAIKPSNTVRNLGVILDQTLSFQQYVSSVCRVCYLELRRISSVRHLLSNDATKTLICAFVLSRLDYCNSLLSGCPKHLLHRLQKVQNNAARLIARRSRSAHVSALLKSLHWLSLEKRIDYKISLLCFKSLNGLAPSYLSDLLHLYVPSRQLRSSADTHLLRIPRFRTKTSGQRSFAYQGPSTWNQLPLSLRSSTSLSTFKSNLKTTLFLTQ